MSSRWLVFFTILILAGCGNNNSVNPFASTTQPPAADAVLMFVSGSWATDPGAPRELFAANADGSSIQRLTTCTQAATPCDFVSVAGSPDRNRIAAVRTTPGAAVGASALYFMDLSRSVEQLIFPRRRVSAVDWSPDGASLLYQSTGDQISDDDNLYICDPNGGNDQLLQLSSLSNPPIRERAPRFDFLSQNAVYERIDETGASRIYLYPAVPLTTGPVSSQALPDTPYFVGGDASPAFAPDTTRIVFRRLTGIGEGGLGTWDLMTVKFDGTDPQTLVSGPVFRGAPDWSSRGIVFVETDVAADESRLVVIQPDGTGRTVVRKEAAGFGMANPRWIRGS